MSDKTPRISTADRKRRGLPLLHNPQPAPQPRQKTPIMTRKDLLLPPVVSKPKKTANTPKLQLPPQRLRTPDEFEKRRINASATSKKNREANTGFRKETRAFNKEYYITLHDPSTKLQSVFVKKP